MSFSTKIMIAYGVMIPVLFVMFVLIGVWWGSLPFIAFAIWRILMIGGDS